MNIVKKLLGKKASSSSFEPDVYVISYPKSGRTWLRALIGKYLSLKYNLPEDRILSSKMVANERHLPKVSFIHDGSAMVDKTRFNDLSSDKQAYADKKVVLMGRDIKDTLVSAYFQATKRIHVFDGSISEFIATEEFGVEKILGFYNIWLRNRHTPESLLFIRYEDLHQDPRGTLGNVLEFIGEASPAENLLDNSIEYCAFNNLKKLESQNKFKKGILKPANTDDPESFKVRKGKIGGYTEYLSAEDVAFIDKAIADHNFDFSKFRAPND
jgi:hypothetical protein